MIEGRESGRKSQENKIRRREEEKREWGEKLRHEQEHEHAPIN